MRMFPFLKWRKKPMNIQVHKWGTRPCLFFDAYANGKCVMRMKCIEYETQVILIGDIIPVPDSARNQYNKGYGSALMDALLKYAKEHNITHIKGNLAVIDMDHMERLHHFYKKFGFKIIIYAQPKESYYGEIHKIIEV